MFNCPHKYIQNSVVYEIVLFLQKHLCKKYFFTTIDEYRKSRKPWVGGSVAFSTREREVRRGDPPAPGESRQTGGCYSGNRRFLFLLEHVGEEVGNTEYKFRDFSNSFFRQSEQHARSNYDPDQVRTFHMDYISLNMSLTHMIWTCYMFLQINPF